MRHILTVAGIYLRSAGHAVCRRSSLSLFLTALLLVPFQTTFMNTSYAVFSTAVLPGGGIWGQTYPYGVMWDEPATNKGCHLWLTVPMDDEKRLGYHTHGINSRYVEFAQQRGSFVLLARNLDDAKNKHPHVLGYVPGGWRAISNEARLRTVFSSTTAAS